ncbi:hypothetical protein E2320_020706, partial [Naja naja]
RSTSPMSQAGGSWQQTLLSPLLSRGRKCALSGLSRACKHRIKLGDSGNYYYISPSCRARITAVCNFFTYIRYIQQGLVRQDVELMYWEVMRLRKEMSIAKLGFYPSEIYSVDIQKIDDRMSAHIQDGTILMENRQPQFLESTYPRHFYPVNMSSLALWNEAMLELLPFFYAFLLSQYIILYLKATLYTHMYKYIKNIPEASAGPWAHYLLATLKSKCCWSLLHNG